MASTQSKTISARIDLAALTQVQAALRPGEKNSDFLAVAIRHELARRRTSAPAEVTLGELGDLAHQALGKANSSQALLRLLDSKLGRIMQELDIQP